MPPTWTRRAWIHSRLVFKGHATPDIYRERLSSVIHVPEQMLTTSDDNMMPRGVLGRGERYTTQLLRRRERLLSTLPSFQLPGVEIVRDTFLL